MTHTHVQLNDVVYNAANQQFEALATVTLGGQTKSYPCAIDAPITMSFDQAAKGLKVQAERRAKKGNGLYSQMRHASTRQRAGRSAFDPRQWLARLGLEAFTKAA